MAFETELGNTAHQTDVISDGITAALVQSVVAMPFVRAEDLPVGTAIKLFRKDGSLTADSLAESTSYTFAAKSELTQSTVSATAGKTVCCTKLTVEAQQFGTVDLASVPRHQGEAVARALDDEILALIASFSTNTVTATSTLTAEDILEAAYSVNASLAGRVGRNLVGIFDHTGVFNVQKQLIQSGATAFSQEGMTTLLAGTTAANGYKGTIGGVDIYETDGCPTSGSDDQQLVFNPDLAFGGIYSPSVQTKMTWVGSGGFWDEVASWIFHKVVEWNDEAGCLVASDT